MDLLLLHQMWADGKSVHEIGERFGVSSGTVTKWQQRYKLPKRGRCYKAPADDPTPNEIEERAAYCRRMREAGTPIGGV